MIRRCALAVWSFVVGEDWHLALAVVVTLALTALAAASGLPAWVLPPVLVLAILYRSVRAGNRLAFSRAPLSGRGEADEAAAASGNLRVR